MGPNASYRTKRVLQAVKGRRTDMARKGHNGMSNARKARGTRAVDTGHSWAEKTYTNPLPVRGAWPTSASGPVIWADATGRPDVRDLARAHGEAPEGDVTTQWVLALSPGMGVRVLLLVRFKRPVRTEFALAFGHGHLEALADIAAAGSVSMVTGEPRIRNGTTECRNVVAFGIDRPGLLEALDRLQSL
jgi:hypothetical protein